MRAMHTMGVVASTVSFFHRVLAAKPSIHAGCERFTVSPVHSANKCECLVSQRLTRHFALWLSHAVVHSGGPFLPDNAHSMLP